MQDKSETLIIECVTGRVLYDNIRTVEDIITVLKLQHQRQPMLIIPKTLLNKHPELFQEIEIYLAEVSYELLKGMASSEEFKNELNKASSDDDKIKVNYELMKAANNEVSKYRATLLADVNQLESFLTAKVEEHYTKIKSVNLIVEYQMQVAINSNEIQNNLLKEINIDLEKYDMGAINKKVDLQ